MPSIRSGISRASKSASAFVLSGFVFATEAAWIFNGEAGLQQQDNITHGILKQDIKADTAFFGGIVLGEHYQPDANNGFDLTASLRGNIDTAYTGLNHYDAGVGLAYKSKFGLGPEAPWLRLSATGEREQYEHALRTGVRFSLAAMAGKRLSSRWNLRGGYRYDEHVSDQVAEVNPFVRRFFPTIAGDAYDTVRHSAVFNLDYNHNDKLTFGLGYTAQFGDVVASTHPYMAILAPSIAVAPDPVFGPQFIAYRLDALTHIVSFNTSLALSAHTSMYFSYQRQISVAAGDLDYDNNSYRAGLLYSF